MYSTVGRSLPEYLYNNSMISGAESCRPSCLLSSIHPYKDHLSTRPHYVISTIYNFTLWLSNKTIHTLPSPQKTYFHTQDMITLQEVTLLVSFVLTCTDVECVSMVLFREFPLLGWGLIHNPQQLHPSFLKLLPVQPTSKISSLHKLNQDL